VGRGRPILRVIPALAAETSMWADNVWVVDSTPVGYGCSRETAKRSDLAGWAEYGYCASRSATSGTTAVSAVRPHGLPVGFALTGAKADERQVLLGIFDADRALLAHRLGQALIGDKNYYGREFGPTMADEAVRLLRQARKSEPLRQTIESINQTFKSQLDLERHGGHTTTGVLVRVLQCILALTAAIRHNDHTGQPVKRSLIAYDHG
jgi:hypothetical protein